MEIKNIKGVGIAFSSENFRNFILFSSDLLLHDLLLQWNDRLTNY